MTTKTAKPETVQDWLALIRIATDADSPFCGMVDLRDIFNVPLPMQHEIFNNLTPEQRDRLKEVYGAKDEAAGS